MPQAPLEAPIPSLVGNPGGLPFSDEMYSHLKFVIEKLSARMKGETALTFDELTKFKDSVERIVLDANIPNVAFVRRIEGQAADTGAVPAPPASAARRVVAPQPQVSSFDDDDDADEVGAGNSAVVYRQAGKRDGEGGEDIPRWMEDIAGTQSTWNVPNMKGLSTEQYYEAVNQRLSAMKNKRKEMGQWEPEPGGSYIDSINKRNRSQ